METLSNHKAIIINGVEIKYHRSVLLSIDMSDEDKLEVEVSNYQLKSYLKRHHKTIKDLTFDDVLNLYTENIERKFNQN